MKRGPRGALLALSVLLAAGCAPDYGAVRDWSATARNALLPPIGQRPADALPAGALRPAPVTAAGREGAVQAAQEAAAAWLALLAWLAEDGLPPGRANLLEAHAAALGPFDATGGQAIAELGAVMADGGRRNWRAPQLRIAVARGDAPFREVLAALGRLLPPDAPEQAVLARVAQGHALLLAELTRLSAPETARRLRLQAGELRRLAASG